MPTVSIIIPSFNVEKFIPSTIESALAQTINDKEIIVIDDGSTDNTFEVARKYEGINVLVIKQPNSGAAIARNTGLKYANGKYIQFLDAGDLMDADKIEKQIKALNGSDSAVAVSDYIQFSREEEILNATHPDQSAFIYSSNNPIDFLINLWGGNGQSNFIQTNCWLTPRALIEKAGYWRSYRCPDDDGEFFSRIILKSSSVIYTPNIYNYYRIDPSANQLSGNKNKKYLMNTLLTIDLKKKYIMDRGGHPKVDITFARQYRNFSVYAYPAQKLLSKIADNRYKNHHVNLPPPLLGGKIIEFINRLFGWKIARLVRSYFSE